MRPHGNHAIVNPNDPSALAECSRCGRWFNLKELTWQMEWAGQRLYNTGLLVCVSGGCLDVPQEQLRTIILPPDPPPVLNARVPDFAYEEQTIIITQFGDIKGPPWAAGPQMIMCDQTGEIPLLLEYNTSS